MPPLAGDVYRSCFSWLSENQRAHEAGFMAARDYWTNIHGHVDELDALIDRFNERVGLLP